LTNPRSLYPRTYHTSHKLSEEWWDKIIAINLTSYYRMAYLCLPSMIERKSGVIVNMSSIQGLQSQAAVPAYAASKGGVLSLTRQLAMEYAKENVRAVSVCPGTIRTPLVTQLLDESGSSYESISNPSLLAGGVGDPHDIAETVLFLSSERAKNITGEYLCNDGGMMAMGAWAT
jgi:NAD(P)-dependent dehydrogenase (short-subunit alcohol dehydrogenase family)